MLPLGVFCWLTVSPCEPRSTRTELSESVLEVLLLPQLLMMQLRLLEVLQAQH